MAKTKKPRLGRGLSSLMASPVSIAPPSPAPAGELAAPPTPPSPAELAESLGGRSLSYIAVHLISPNPHQPRQTFDSGSLEQLAESIRQDGMMQPIVLRPAAQSGRYELVAGERRWRAAQLARLEQVPALIRDLSDQQIAEWALIENLQRENLDPIERAQAFHGLVEQFALSHDQVAERVGIERPTVSNALRLLELPESVQQSVRSRQLSAGHARALLSLSDAQAQTLMARKATEEGWSVRQIEQAVRDAVSGEPRSTTSADPAVKLPARRSPHVIDLEKQLANQLQTKVHVKPGRKKGTGVVSIEYYSLDQFDALLTRMGLDVDE